MSLAISNILAEAEAEIGRQRDSWRTALKRSQASNPLAASATGLQSTAGYGLTLSKHDEQYDHFKGWAYTAISVIARRIAGQPPCMGRTKPKGANGHGERHKAVLPFGRRLPTRVKAAAGGVEVLESHALLDALSAPNDIMVPWALLYSWACSIDITGKAYWWLPIVDGRQQVWPFPVHWVTPRHKPDELFAEYIVRPSGHMGEPWIVPAADMVYFSLPDPEHPLDAISPLQAAAPAVATDEQLQIANYRSFKNNLFPGIIMRVGRLPGMMPGQPGERPVLTPEQRMELTETARAIFEGAVNYNEPFIVDGMIEGVERFTLTPAEMDYLRSGEAVKSRIFQAFGVNPVVVGEITGVNRAQAAVADQMFCSNVVNPLQELIGQTMTAWLRKHRDERLMFWLEPAQPEDAELALQQWRLAGELAMYDPSLAADFRAEVLGLPPRPKREEPKPAPKPPAEEEPPEADDSEESQEQVEGEARARARSVVPSSHPGFRRRFANYWVRQVADSEGLVQAALHEHFRSQWSAVEREFKRLADESPQLLANADAARSVAEQLFRPREWDRKLAEAAETPFTAVIARGYLAAQILWRERLGKAASKRLSDEEYDALLELIQGGLPPAVDFDLPPALLARIQQHVHAVIAQPWWKRITDTQLEDLGRVLAREFEAGSAMSTIGKALSDEVFDGNLTRSLLTAKTECLPAETLIDGAQVRTAYRRWYRGPMVKIVTHGGRELTATPNHPVLTVRGWVALGDLTEADRLVCHASGIQSSIASRNPDVQTPPATIGQVYDALAAVGVSQRRSAGEPDFHGDGQEGEIDIAAAGRILALGHTAALDKGLVQRILAPANTHGVIADANGDPLSLAGAIHKAHRIGRATEMSPAAANGPDKGTFGDAVFPGQSRNRLSCQVSVRNANVGQVLPQRRAPTLDDRQAAGVSVGSHHAGLPDREGHHVLGQAKRSGHLMATAPGQVLRNDGGRLGGRQAALGGRERSHSACAPALLHNPRLAVANPIGDSVCGQAGLVELDRLSHKVWIPDWSGHVYNLSTRDGYFLANTLYTRNCTGLVSEGHKMQAEDLEKEGLGVVKTWHTTMINSRPSHVAMNGQEAYGSGGLFDVSGYQVPYPGHPDLPPDERCNCQCAFFTDVAEGSLEAAEAAETEE